MQEMSDRADEVVSYVRKMHTDWLSDASRKEDDKGGDVVVITHGHFSRIFVARWLGLPLAQGQLFTVDVGGVSRYFLNGQTAGKEKMADICCGAGVYWAVLP